MVEEGIITHKHRHEDGEGLANVVKKGDVYECLGCGKRSTNKADFAETEDVTGEGK